MHPSRSAALTLLCSACVVLTFIGCADENPNDPIANQPPPRPAGGPPGAPGGPGGGPGGGAPASNPQLKELMAKIGRGPQALQGSLGAALKQSETAWDVVQPKAHEYATLSAEMSKYDPVKGTKDSWTKLTSEFTQAAAELDKAAQAKDKEKTTAALDTLGSSCSACHREHRVMGPPGGGFRGGPPGGMGGPPPGGFRPGPPPGSPGANEPATKAAPAETPAKAAGETKPQ